MAESEVFFADDLGSLGTARDKPIAVELKNELAPLLSHQLYRSPLKAIEELVVNSYDAGAKECRLFVPSPSDLGREYILVYDDGIGMNEEGLEVLWQVGRSNKRDEEIELRAERQQIGKFGIGKLATYAIAYKLTHISKVDDCILSVTVDFRQFDDEGGVELPVVQIDELDRLWDAPHLPVALADAGVEVQHLRDSSSWTIAFLEDLKPKKRNKLRLGLLKRVLRTAMPLRDDFQLFLNTERIESSKEDLERVVEFDLTELPEHRIEALCANTGEKWEVTEDGLIAPSFKSGVRGKVFMTGKRTLTGKSDDLLRSYGFFIRVRGRLINEEDPFFGLGVKSYANFNRFRADIEADDLDSVLTAPREGIEDSELKEDFEKLLNMVFNEARKQRDDWQKESLDKNKRRQEGIRNYMNPALVEYPVADVLMSQSEDQMQSEADGDWFYLDLAPEHERDDVVKQLYDESLDTDKRRKYDYRYASYSPSNRLVRFDPSTSTFTINTNHDFAREHYSEETQNTLLEDVVTAEALLEIYLREHRVSPGVIGEVLERRDRLLRSLAKDHPYSLNPHSAVKVDV